jgi:hypothetical protein
LKLTEELKVPRDFIELTINCSLLNTKLQVIGNSIQDKRIDIKGTFAHLSSELMNILVCAGKLLPTPLNSLEVVGIENKVAEGITPIVQFHYFGVAVQDRKQEVIQ